jgi:hypothetical protein
MVSRNNLMFASLICFCEVVAQDRDDHGNTKNGHEHSKLFISLLALLCHQIPDHSHPH